MKTEQTLLARSIQLVNKHLLVLLTTAVVAT